VAGGYYNTASGIAATVSGGSANTASGISATVPGGQDNQATGASSLAAGNGARAMHDGTFVWADATGGNFASTSNHQFLIRAAGGVGIGTNNPAGAALAVNGLVTSTTAHIAGQSNWDLNNTEGDFRVGTDTYRFKVGVSQGGGGAGDVWMRAHGGSGRIFIKTPGGTTIYSNEGQTTGVSLASGGGSWTSVSDRNAKENFAPVDPQDVLEKVVALPLAMWNYKSQDASIRHLGPMAQDFKAAFGLGADHTSIATVDADGVALAAIQGLNRKVEIGKTELAELRSELKRRDAENATLKARLERLERLLESEFNGGAK
jgi:hypothetical protein